MMKTKKSSKGLALVLAAVLALTPMAGFPITALATGDTAAPKAEAPATDAADVPAVDAGDTPQVDAPATPGTTPSTPAPDAETPQAEAATNPNTAGSATNPPAASVATPNLTPTSTPLAATPMVDPDAATGVVINEANFPDDTFRSRVQYYDKKKDGILDTDEIKAVTYIDLSEMDITTLQGIEHFTALTHLNCSFNDLTALDVSANTALTELFCTFNQITALDISANTALTFLDCTSNRQIATLDLPKSTALTHLRCGDNKLTTLDISSVPALTRLSCWGNQLTTLDVSAYPALTELSCGYNQLTTLDLSNNSALTHLDCSESQLTTLDVSTKKALTRLYCGNNQLTTLDVSANTALTWLKCDNNQLTTLDVSANTALTGLDCDNNQLTTLDLKNLTNLQWFWVSPQRSDVVIPVIKRDTYEVDATAFAGRSKAKIDGRDLAADGKVELSAPPKLVTYTFKADSPYLSDVEKTVTVEAKNFDYSYLATLDAGTNGTLTFDGTPSTSAEILLAEKSEPTFTVTPASGYQVATLTVNGEDVKESLVAKDATSQTLTLPPVADTVAIAATFEKIPAPPKPPTPIVNFYSVTATAENGTITSDHATLVREGSSVKCTFSPKESYAFESVSVNGELVKATEEGTTTAKTYSYNINSIYSNTTIHVSFKAVEPPVDPIDPIDPPKPPVDPTDPVDPPKPPVDSVDPINPPTPPAVPDNGGNGNNNGGNTTIVERTNTVVVPAAPQAATLATPATLAATAVKTEAPAKATADTATLQGQLENPALGAQAFDNQHSHIPLALLLLAVWLVGGFAVIRQRKHTHDAIEGASY